MKIEITEGTAKAIAKIHSETAIPDFAIIEMAVQFYKFQEHLSELTSRNISEYLRSNVPAAHRRCRAKPQTF